MSKYTDEFKVAILFWPTHPFEETERIEDMFDLLELRIAPPNPEQGEYVRVPRTPTIEMLAAMQKAGFENPGGS